MILFWLALLAGIAVVTVALWKFGLIHEAEHPVASEEKSILDPRQRKAVLARLNRWKEEGKLTRAEFERILALCESDW